jgi:hypothetical protein
MCYNPRFKGAYMPESYTGEFRNGVVVFDGITPPLAEGTKVRIELFDVDLALDELSASLLSVAGKAIGLPSDLAENHDHYLHGTQKRP